MIANDLPVNEVLSDLHDALDKRGAAVLIAPPGAGKTTAVPLALLKATSLDGQKIVLLEPRRLAARAAARRMAAMLGQKVGETVGYRMRTDTKVGPETRIEIVTEGVFQRMILDDPELTGIGCVIFDEFHERSLDADFGLALTLDVRSALREDLRLLVMSATLDGGRVATLLGYAPMIESTGRAFDVDIRHLPRNADQRPEDAMASAIRKALMEEEGSILAFLPGVAEIRRVEQRLEGKLPQNAFVVPLFGAMDIKDQDVAIKPAPDGQRKIVLATSLAESSITIDGVRIVVDSGLARVPFYEAGLGIARLETKRASQASVTQRSGRAGRTAPGVAYRLWQKEQTAALPSFETPEIMQADLSSLVLNCAAWGLDDPAKLQFLDAPPKPHLTEARKLLTSIDALDPEGRITDKGKRISAIGLEPRLASMVVAAESQSDAERRAFLALLLGERGLGGNEVDLSARFARAMNDKNQRAISIRSLAKRMARTVSHIAEGSAQQQASVGLMLCDAFPDRVARRRDQSPDTYILANGRAARIDETDPLAQHRFLVVADLVGSASSARIVAAAPLSEQELESRFAAETNNALDIVFDKSSGKLRATKALRLGAIKLQTTPAQVIAGDEAAAALIAAVRSHGLGILPWTKSATALRERLNWLAKNTDGDWPDMSDHSLLDGLEEWLAPFLAGKTGFDQLSGEDLKNALLSRVDYALHPDIDRLAPTHFEVPTGSKIALDYAADDQAPTLSVRVQELFGLKTHPSIANGAVPLAVELLSPAHRPVQLTRDLPGFWQGSWADLRSDMRGRYPRHEWPEDPASANPTRRAKPKK